MLRRVFDGKNRKFLSGILEHKGINVLVIGRTLHEHNQYEKHDEFVQRLLCWISTISTSTQCRGIEVTFLSRDPFKKGELLQLPTTACYVGTFINEYLPVSEQTRERMKGKFNLIMFDYSVLKDIDEGSFSECAQQIKAFLRPNGLLLLPNTYHEAPQNFEEVQFPEVVGDGDSGYVQILVQQTLMNIAENVRVKDLKRAMNIKRNANTTGAEIFLVHGNDILPDEMLVKDLQIIDLGRNGQVTPSTDQWKKEFGHHMHVKPLANEHCNYPLTHPIELRGPHPLVVFSRQNDPL
jgi:hypothetical protein